MSGIYQFVTVSILTPFGVPHDDALAYSFVSQAMGYVVVLALGLPVLFRLKDWRQAIAASHRPPYSRKRPKYRLLRAGDKHLFFIRVHRCSSAA